MSQSFGLGGLHISAGTMDTVITSRRGLACLINILAYKAEGQNIVFHLIDRLPYELRDCILDMASTTPSLAPSQLAPVNLVNLSSARNPAMPPSDRSKKPIMSLPYELLRDIINESLPAKGTTIKCLCGQASEKAADRVPKRNRVSDLMTVCKEFKEQVKLAVYQERFFEVHVHQGGTGGVELLDAGMQPLAYMESGSDDRFTKFTTADEYGFQHLKKIEISIFPTTNSKRSKEVSLNTYFMVQALCRLLERGEEEKDRLVNVTITFPKAESNTDGIGRHNIISNNHYWWDPTSQLPRASSLHGLPDIELVLQPFAKLTRVHNVNIVLPRELIEHVPTQNYVQRLTAAMKSAPSVPNNSLSLSVDQENMISSMRQEVEDYIFAKRFGRSQVNVEKLGENEVEDDQPEDDFGEDDGGFKRSDLKRARDASLGTPSNIKQDKRRKMMTDFLNMTEEELEEQSALMESFSRSGNRLSDSNSSTSNDNIPLTGQLRRQRRERVSRKSDAGAATPSQIRGWNAYADGMASTSSCAFSWMQPRARGGIPLPAPVGLGDAGGPVIAEGLGTFEGERERRHSEEKAQEKIGKDSGESQHAKAGTRVLVIDDDMDMDMDMD